MLQQPDLPVSRTRFLLEALPQEGFGHVSFIAWPGGRSNVLCQFAMSPWAHYRTAYRFTETIKYILSQLADKGCLNELNGLGVTALGLSAQHGSLAVSRILLEAGIDPNAGLARTPLNAAREWLNNCVKREERSHTTDEPGEKKLATRLRAEAEETEKLLMSYGGIDQACPNRMYSALLNGQFKPGSSQVGIQWWNINATK